MVNGRKYIKFLDHKYQEVYFGNKTVFSKVIRLYLRKIFSI